MTPHDGEEDLQSDEPSPTEATESYDEEILEEEEEWPDDEEEEDYDDIDLPFGDDDDEVDE